jgi:hypothetical protein
MRGDCGIDGGQLLLRGVWCAADKADVWRHSEELCTRLVDGVIFD